LTELAAKKFTDIIEAISDAKSIIVTGHVMPDGDSIGSTLALGLAITKLGKNVVMACPDDVPGGFMFLPGAKKIKSENISASEHDMIVVVDCSAPDRIGKLQELLNVDRITVMNIDHHVNGVCFADVSYIDPKAAATGEIIFDLLSEMGDIIDIDIATNLYTAIVTDTGLFRYEATTSSTHRRAATLLDLGVPVAKVSRNLFDEKPFEVFMVLKEALNNLCCSGCGKVAWISIDWDALQRIGAKDEHTRELVNYPRRIKGVEVALMFRETSTGLVKISMRSNGDIDVNAIATEFGGGGHKKAAGCLMEGKIDDIKEKVIKRVMAAVM